MPITICFDFGNTRKKAAIFNGKKFAEEIVLNDDSTETISNLIDRFHPDRSILSSVINHDPAMEKLLSSKTKFHKLSHLTKLPFTTPVAKAETIGADRLA